MIVTIINSTVDNVLPDFAVVPLGADSVFVPGDLLHYVVVDEPDPRTTMPLPDLATLLCCNITAEELRRDNLPILYNGARYDADTLAKSRMQDVCIGLSLGVTAETYSWTDADNVSRELTPANLLEIYAAITTRTQVLHAVARAAKDAILAASTREEMAEIFDNINWE